MEKLVRDTPDRPWNSFLFYKIVQRLQARRPSWLATATSFELYRCLLDKPHTTSALHDLNQLESSIIGSKDEVERELRLLVQLVGWFIDQDERGFTGIWFGREKWNGMRPGESDMLREGMSKVAKCWDEEEARSTKVEENEEELGLDAVLRVKMTQRQRKRYNI